MPNPSKTSWSTFMIGVVRTRTPSWVRIAREGAAPNGYTEAATRTKGFTRRR